MEIAIDVNRANFYNVYLSFLNPVLKLRPAERSVLAVILTLICSSKRPLAETLSSVFSTATKKEMRAALKMSENSFNNCICSLKKAGILIETKDGLDAIGKLKINLLKDQKLTINFKIK